MSQDNGITQCFKDPCTVLRSQDPLCNSIEISFLGYNMIHKSGVEILKWGIADEFTKFQILCKVVQYYLTCISMGYVRSWNPNNLFSVWGTKLILTFSNLMQYANSH